MKDTIILIVGLIVIAGASFMAGRWLTQKPQPPVLKLMPAASSEARECAGDCAIFSYPNQTHPPLHYAI